MSISENKKAVMYGAGNIGRGFIAQLLYMSNYNTVFIDVNEQIINAVNEKREYPLYITNGDNYDIVNIKNICAVNGNDINAVAENFIDADIVVTAVGANVLKYIKKPFAEGIIKRFEQTNVPLNIILCENLMEADKYFKSLVSECLPDDKKHLLDKVGFIEASVGRMVPVTPDNIKKENLLAVCAEPFYPLPVDGEAVVGTLPDIKYIYPVIPFSFYIRRKLFMHNMAHTAAAYNGYIKGYKYIWETMYDDEVYNITKGALDEISQAMAIEYKIDQAELKSYSDELIERFKNKLLGDTIERVGRDTIRKLAVNDRITGAFLLCRRHNIKAENIIKTMKAAFLFNPDGDVFANETYEFAKSNGLDSAIEKYCGINYEDVKCIEK